jgi:hypothetical protein
MARTRAKRLAEALRTLRNMPVNGYPAGFVNAWPAVVHEYSDRTGYEDDPVWKAERAAESYWTKPRPSSIEIARMETAIVWPARYLSHVPQLLRTVQAVALARARDRDIAHAARKLGLPGRLARQWNDEGLDLIAAGAVIDYIAAFNLAAVSRYGDGRLGVTRNPAGRSGGGR